MENKNFLLFLSKINIEGSFWVENCRYIQVGGNYYERPDDTKKLDDRR